MKKVHRRGLVGVLISLAILFVAYLFDGALSSKTLEYSDRVIHWYVLIPPLVTVGLAFVIRRILVALLIGVVTGALIIHNFHIVAAAKATVVTYLWGNFSNEFSYLIVIFVFALIGMVSIVNKGGGTLGVVELFARTIRGARSACLATMAMGLAIFFDDYTNTIVVGSTMRSLTDRMKISREKLAYIVDSTTAPIAGLALISTWIGFEVEQLQHVATSMHMDIGGYGLFVKMLPYRYYCIFTIMFVFLISFLRRDFGPMLKAERRAWYRGLVSNPESMSVTSHEFSESHVKDGAPARWYNAATPVLVVVLSCLVGLVVVGAESPAMADKVFNLFSFSSWYDSFIGVGQVKNGIPMILCVASIVGAVFASILFLSQKILSVGDVLRAFFHGWRIIFVIAALLVLAWAIRQVCYELGTAYYILAIVQNLFSPNWLPLAIFIIASLTAFATGTSWGTMGILFPILAPVAANSGDIGFVVICLGAILDGAIFGDHCSPISDTTILSSISTNCDLIDHVRTQLPYALVVAAIAGIAGYIPASFGTPFLATYCLGLALMVAIVFLLGRKISGDNSGMKY
jgi:Na+/H+ antiporter NhaC